MHKFRVRTDVINSLRMNDPYVAIGSFDRENLFYGVKHFNRGTLFVNELVQEISKFAGNGGSTIIYCTTIKDVEQVLFSSHFLIAICFLSLKLVSLLRKGHAYF